jgi:hypothetical protein
MTAEEKNAIVGTAKDEMTAAMTAVALEVFGGLTAGAVLLGSASALLGTVGHDTYAAEAAGHAAACAGILAIPWPLIYIASNAWIAGVRQLRDSVPLFIDLEPVARQADARKRVLEQRATQTRASWDKLPEAQRAILTGAGITPDLLCSLRSSAQSA